MANIKMIRVPHQRTGEAEIVCVFMEKERKPYSATTSDFLISPIRGGIGAHTGMLLPR
jgi:hypothetical protein